MKWLGIIYSYLWYWSQFAVRKTHLRRPFTFVMRDHPWAFWLILTPSFGVIIYFSWVPLKIILGLLWAFIAGHIYWGSKHIIGQQEKPTFDPLHPIASYTAIQEARRIR